MNGHPLSKVELALIRHGQSDWNVERRCQGQLDFSRLTEEGRAQAASLARDLARLRFDAVTSSSQTRAAQTAEIIAGALNLPVTIDPRLGEMGQGVWEGMTYTDIMAQHGKHYQQFMDNPLLATPPGGESIRQVAARMKAAADDIARTYPGGRVAVVSHEIPLAALACVEARQPLSALWAHAPTNGQILNMAWPPDSLNWLEMVWQRLQHRRGVAESK